MKKKNWIYALIVTLIIIIAIVSMIFFVQTKYGDQSEKGSQSVSNKNNKIHIAIVNEDQPTTYNGKKVELGQAFIKRLANEKNYKFETVTRNVAESGLKNGGYQVMIVIPENFSKLAMQLDAKTPSKISLQYKTAVGQKEEVAKNTEKVVSNVLNDFNKNLVEIYLTSIIDNLHNAQKNVGAIMTREHGVNSKFSNYLLNPINDFPELFTDTLVNSISANKDITKWFQTYNKSLLSANSDTFRVNTDYNVSTLIEKPNSLFDEHNAAMDKMLQDYKSQKDSVELDNYINALKQMDSQIDQQSSMQDTGKEEYKQTVKENLDKLREIIQSQESPFSKGMIEDYRKQLTESLQDELANNKDLQDALNSIKMNNAQFAENLEKQLHDDIVKEPDTDTTFIYNMSKQDFIAAGLNEDEANKYEAIVKEAKRYKNEYNLKKPLAEHINLTDYDNQVAQDTSSLINDGVKVQRTETIKSNDINQLTVATDPHFNFEGDIKINGKKYDIKDQSVQLDTSNKEYKVEVNGVAKLKKDAEKDFLKDKTMHLQLLFGQANRQDEPNDKKATSVVDVTLNHNLDGRLSKDALSQQLSALSRFDAHYKIYTDTKGREGKPFDNKRLIDMMVDQVINDMESFKDDKVAVLHQIDSMEENSDKLIDDILNNKKNTTKNKEDISKLIDQLENVKKTFAEEPQEPKIDKGKNDEFNTMSSNLDKEISRISEKSTQLLSDTQESKSIADSVSGQLNQVDNNVNKLHATGRALGVRANDLNRQMAKNDKENDLFAKEFKKVLQNSKDGDRQNQALKAFMSNPVQKKNLENVLANNGNTDVISPTLFVLLMYLLSMITAYIFYSYERAKGQMNFIKDDYSSKNHLWNNIITSGVIGTTGLVEGLIVGLIAMNKFHVLAGYRAKFILMVILTMMVFVLINTYLLRQVKSIGMFLMIAALGLYFVAMNNLKAAGQGVTNKISPLSYIDNMFFNYLNAEHPIGLALVILTVLVIIGFVLNMFIKHFKKERLI
ncbi:TPA: type VII secretion protein EsaA [Staphylococcus aureus]|nr:type VII secretion protein EsaA [Staphylococcus aureus]